MMNGSDVARACSNPHPLGSRVRVDDALHDGLGHSAILSVDDGKKRCFDT
jgi:hypothetical protein